MATLAAEHVILYPARPRPGYADQVLGHFRARGLVVSSSREVNELQAAVGLVAAGVGVTLVPSCVRRLRRDDVRYKPITDAGVTSPVVMMYRADDRSAAVSRFRDGVQRTKTAAEGRPPMRARRHRKRP